MKDKLNRFMQGRYGVDNFARFTLGVALFVIVVGSFMRQTQPEAFWIQLDLFLSFIHISESFPEISLHDMRKTRNIWDILRKSAAGLPERKI